MPRVMCVAVEDAGALTKDLLTIRANCDHYYFGMDDLLSRHTDNVKQLTENAPTLPPALSTASLGHRASSRMNVSTYDFIVESMDVEQRLRRLRRVLEVLVFLH